MHSERRYATFKLFYLDHTPDDYEPPHFRSGDPVKDKYVFATHNPSECPEKFSVGSIVTPHHGYIFLHLVTDIVDDAFIYTRVDLKIRSVAKYIPNDEKDDFEFLGVESVADSTFKSSSKNREERSRSHQVEAQKVDAEARRVIWDAEDSRLTDADAEGEDDPDYVNDSGVELVEPLGVKTDDGNIRPLTAEDIEAANAMDVDDGEEQFFGRPDFEPERLGQLVSTSLKLPV